MKKYLLIFLTCFLIYSTKAQVVFCPQGAEWSYNFTIQGPHIPSVLEKITYARDSTLGSETVKVLRHSKFYTSCNGLTPITLIKQKGDTVFMRNVVTKHTWQILYNFNTQAGQTWETDFLSDIYTVTVDSIDFISENGFSLKRLFVQYELVRNLYDTVRYTEIITERFGCNSFLFNYLPKNYQSCDSDWLRMFLCYKDNTFGTKQFTNYACDYQTVGINEQPKENESIKMYPNPVSDFLTLEISFSVSPIHAEVVDLTGKVFIKQDYINTSVIDVHDLSNGVYFLNLYQQDKFLSSKKLAIIK